MILDSTRAKNEWGWTLSTKVAEILEEIACHAEKHPDWLGISGSQ